MAPVFYDPVVLTGTGDPVGPGDLIKQDAVGPLDAKAQAGIAQSDCCRRNEDVFPSAALAAGARHLARADGGDVKPRRECGLGRGQSGERQQSEDSTRLQLFRFYARWGVE
jgi:hypothetical protein